MGSDQENHQHSVLYHHNTCGKDNHNDDCHKHVADNDHEQYNYRHRLQQCNHQQRLQQYNHRQLRQQCDDRRSSPTRVRGCRICPPNSARVTKLKVSPVRRVKVTRAGWTYTPLSLSLPNTRRHPNTR